MSIDMNQIMEARERLEAARSAVVLTGAGISADSGVPTFRGPEGLWREHCPEELATPAAFARDPRLVWEWYGWRRSKIAPREPNAAHLALARWALRRVDVRIVTQNVDGLHTRAAETVAGPDPTMGSAMGPGAPADGTSTLGAGGTVPARGGDAAPLELHGCLFRVRCTECGLRREHREEIDATSRDALPRCPECGGLLRPDVVWFGEPLPGAVVSEAFALAREAEVCLVVGTSAVVHPAAGIATATAAAGGEIIEVNPEPTPLTGRASVSLHARAAEAVPRLVEPAS